MIDARDTLVENMRALMDARPERVGTQAKIAQLAGVDQTTVGKLLRKQHHPTTEVLQGLARAFGVEVWQLLTPKLKPVRTFELSPFALDIAEMIDSRMHTHKAREAREAIYAQVIHQFGPGSELDVSPRPSAPPTAADTTTRRPCASGTPADKIHGRP